MSEELLMLGHGFSRETLADLIRNPGRVRCSDFKDASKAVPLLPD
jgi:hypothetical protein